LEQTLVGAELAKFLVYRTPILRRTMSPKYKYKVNPGQLAAIVNLINDTQASGGAVIEIGVAQGDTSSFILEHMKTTGDARTVYLMDTFEGFTEDSIEHEVNARGKPAAAYDAFRYGSEALFTKYIRAAGYDKFKTIRGDASKFDWATLGGIGAVLLDIDLYEPTIKILNGIWPHVVPGGGVVVDDCLAGSPWDGSLQAYEEFIAAHNLPFRRVGAKGALVVKPS
jgi:O-methyltransferase